MASTVLINRNDLKFSVKYNKVPCDSHGTDDRREHMKYVLRFRISQTESNRTEIFSSIPWKIVKIILSTLASISIELDNNRCYRSGYHRMN